MVSNIRSDKMEGIIPSDIEANTTTSSSTAWPIDQLTTELCELCLELPQMVACGLILLGWKTTVSKSKTGSGI